MWAGAFAVYIFLPYLAGIIGLPQYFGNSDFLTAVDLCVSILAGLASSSMVEKARNVVFVQKALKDQHSQFVQRQKLFLLWWIAYFGIIIASAVFFNAHLLSIVFGLATTVTVFFYYIQRSSFQGKLPPEGIVAISIFGFAATASLVLSFLASNDILYGILWGVTIITWILASMYSLLTASDELTLEEALNR